MNLFSKKNGWTGLLVITVSMLLFSCKEYKPFIECTINGTTHFRVETTVSATYVGNVSSVGAQSGNTAVNIRFNSLSPGNYTCGTSGNATIEVFISPDDYTTTSINGSGTVQVITAGNNLIEGYFSGQLYSSSDHIVVTNGSFSGRAY